jgi:hypothetical protein
MQNHDPSTHNSFLASMIGDVIKGDKNKSDKSSSVWVRMMKVTLRITMIGLLMASPFILLVLLVVIFG